MLHTLNDLKDFSIHATDGDIGLTKDFYFDDKQWVIRYLVSEEMSIPSSSSSISPSASSE